MTTNMKKKIPERIKVVETPKVLQDGEYENATELKDVPILNNIFSVRTIVEDCDKWGTTIQITEWANKTGYDITQCGSQGSFQHMSITKEEADIISEIINKMK